MDLHLNTFSCASRSATQAAGIDTILVDVWTSLIPPNGYTPDTLWTLLESPNPGILEATGAYGVPMSMKYINATQSLVRDRVQGSGCELWCWHLSRT